MRHGEKEKGNEKNKVQEEFNNNNEIVGKTVKQKNRIKKNSVSFSRIK